MDNLVVGGGLFLGLRSVEVSHLQLNTLKEEFQIRFHPYRGFALGMRLHLVSLVLVIFIHI